MNLAQFALALPDDPGFLDRLVTALAACREPIAHDGSAMGFHEAITLALS